MAGQVHPIGHTAGGRLVLEALKIRDFRHLWIGRLISTAGSWLLVVALPAYVFHLTGSLLATGLTMVAEYLPALLLGPIAGVLTDRWDRRRVMLASDVFRAVVVAGMLFATSRESVWVIYVALVAESIGSVLFRPAAQAMTPAIVGAGSALSSANSLNAVTDGTVRLIGPPAGAAVLSLAGFQALIWIDMASYLLSAVAVYRTTSQPRRRREEYARGRVLADLVAGFGLLRAEPVGHALLLLTTVFLFANASLSALLVPFGIERLGGSEQVGIVVSGLGVGFLVGAVVIRAVVDRVQPRYLLAATQLATTVGFLLLFGSSSLAVALSAALIIGMFGSMTLVTPQTTLQRVVPNAALGRVSAIFFTAEALATLAGAVAGPALAGATSFWTTAVASCVVSAVGALVGIALLPVSSELLPARGEAADE